jgi:acyl-CoA synthetase (AMP-forming)/AMP-acid ligase II
VTDQLRLLLEEAAARYPDKAAVVFEGRRLSFAELRRRANEVAADLRSRGVGAGASVGVNMANSPHTVVGLVAAWAVGAAVVDLSPGLGRAERRAALERTGATLLWSEGGLQAADGGASNRPRRDPDRYATDGLACVTFTSGSTGIPKGVMLGQENLIRNAELYAAHFGLTPGDTTSLVLPLSFGMNKIALLAHLLIGATVLLEPDFAVPNRALAAMAAHRATGICLVPAAAGHLLSRGDLDRYRLDDLRYVRIGAGRTDLGQVRGLRQRFPRAEIFLTYGLTEVGLVAAMTAGELEERPRSCGRVIPAVEVRIDDAGEVVVRAGHQARGYWEDEAATRAVFQPDGVHTGDLGRLDRDEYLYLTGRAKDVIKSGGENIDPVEVEGALLAHPDVAECAVVGVPDAWLGEHVEAFVVPVVGVELDEADLRAHATRVLPSIKRPRRYTVSRSLPRTDTGKVRRASLAPAVDVVQPPADEMGGTPR